MTDIMQVWTEYGELEKRRRNLDAELKAVKERMEELQPSLLENMAEGGIDKLSMHGITFYLRRQVFGSVKDGFDKRHLVEALRESNLGDMVSETVNARTFDSYVSAFQRESGTTLSTEEILSMMPEALQAVVRVGERYSIATRKA